MLDRAHPPALRSGARGETTSPHRRTGAMRYIGLGRRFVALLIDALITATRVGALRRDVDPATAVYSIRWDGMDFVFPLLHHARLLRAPRRHVRARRSARSCSASRVRRARRHAHRVRGRRDPQPGPRRRRVPLRHPVPRGRDRGEPLADEAAPRRPVGQDGGDPRRHRVEAAAQPTAPASRRPMPPDPFGLPRPRRPGSGPASVDALRPPPPRLTAPAAASTGSYQRGSRESSAARPVHSVPTPYSGSSRPTTSFR